MRTNWMRCLLIALAISVPGYAEVKVAPHPLISIPLRIFLVDGLEISPEKASGAIDEARKRIKEELHINIRRIGWSHIADIAPERTVFNWSNELFSWKLLFRGSRQLRMIIAPAIKGPDTTYAGGLGYVCFYKTFALSEVFTKETFDDGTDSFLGVVTIMEHELGHQLGALHDEDSISVMYPSSTDFGRFGRLYFTDKSKREIRKCMRGLRK